MMTQLQTIEILSEAEIQLLIAMIELDAPKETPNNNFYQFHPANLEQASKYFRRCREAETLLVPCPFAGCRAQLVAAVDPCIKL